MNPARLAELNHQRALVQQQLAWLDREIARESGSEVESPPPATTPPAVVAPASGSLAGMPSPSLSEIEAYAPDPVATAADARRGCFLVAVFALLVMLGALTAIYFWRYRDRPLFFPASDLPATATPRK